MASKKLTDSVEIAYVEVWEDNCHFTGSQLQAIGRLL